MIALLLVTVMAAPASSGRPQPDPAAVIAPATDADRIAAARRQAELRALEAVLETERGRPSGARVREVVDRQGHGLVLFVTRPGGVVERARSFEPGFPVGGLYALVLDRERRIRLLLVEPQGTQDAYQIDQILFGRDGKVTARDHAYGTYADCVDGRFHERRIVTVFGSDQRVIERKIEFLNDPPGTRPGEGCAFEAAVPPYPDAASLLRAHHLEGPAREAGVLWAEGDEGARERL